MSMCIAIVSNQLRIRTIIFYVTISSSVYIPLLHQATSDIRITLNFTTSALFNNHFFIYHSDSRKVSVEGCY